MYRDPWRTKTDRAQAVQNGIIEENLRKLIRKDDYVENTGNTTKVSEGLMYSIHGTKQKLRLDRINEDHCGWSAKQSGMRASQSHPRYLAHMALVDL